jgi:hypothetical protein
MYATLYSNCFFCKDTFGCNPHKVPSTRRAPDAPREAICSPCMDELNRQLLEAGKPPHPVHPDAYEPIPESQL